MNTEITNTDSLHSLDFSVLTLLFAVLYGISAQGYRASKDHGWMRAAGLRLDSMQNACTTAFIGIIVSFSLGWSGYLVPSKYLALELVAPAALIGMWWRFERRGSSILDFDALASSLNDNYVTLVLVKAKEKDPQNKGLTRADEDLIYTNCLQTVATEQELLPEAMNRIFPNSRALVPVKALATVARSLMFSRDRFDLILDDLRSKKVLSPKVIPVPIGADSKMTHYNP